MSILKNITLFVTFAIFVAGCHGSDKKKLAEKEQIVVAKMQTPVQRLYFTGSLSPIATMPVVSPVDGNIVSRNFEYGERVEQGRELFVIDSKTLAENYRKAVNDFIQKKQSYESGKTTFQGTQALFKAGVVAKNDYDNAKTGYENKELDFLQSKYSLEKILKTANVDVNKVSSQKIESLTLADTTKVNALLERHFRNIEIFAPGSGVALFPKKLMSGAAEISGKLETGTSIKEGQLLLSIGDLSGLSAEFNVSEVDIDRIKDKMPVLVTGSAFPGAELKGYVSAVSVQATQGGGGGGLSMYSVSTKIPKVDPEVMKKIRVGMTAKFEIDIKGEPRIMLPVDAVFEDNGRSVVTILDAKNKSHIVPVMTGITTPTDVVIVSGVKPGDKILIPPPEQPKPKK